MDHFLLQQLLLNQQRGAAPLHQQQQPNQQQIPFGYQLNVPQHQQFHQHQQQAPSNSYIGSMNEPAKIAQNVPLPPGVTPAVTTTVRNVANVAPLQQQPPRQQSPQQATSFMKSGAGASLGQQKPSPVPQQDAKNLAPSSSSTMVVNQYGDADDRLLNAGATKRSGGMPPNYPINVQTMLGTQNQHLGIGAKQQSDISRHSQAATQTAAHLANLAPQNSAVKFGDFDYRQFTVSGGSGSQNIGNVPIIGPNVSKEQSTEATNKDKNAKSADVPPIYSQIFAGTATGQQKFQEDQHHHQANTLYQTSSSSSGQDSRVVGQNQQQQQHTVAPKTVSPAQKIGTRTQQAEGGAFASQSVESAAEDIFGNLARDGDSLQRIIDQLQILSETGGISSEELFEKLTAFKYTSDGESVATMFGGADLNKQQKASVSGVGSNGDFEAGFNKKDDAQKISGPTISESAAPQSSMNADVLSNLLDTLSQFTSDLHNPPETMVVPPNLPNLNLAMNTAATLDTYGCGVSLFELQNMYESVMDRVWDPIGEQDTTATLSANQETAIDSARFEQLKQEKYQQLEQRQQEPTVIDLETYQKKKDEKYQELEASFRRQQAATMYDRLTEKKAEFANQITSLEARKVDIDEQSNSLNDQLSDLKKQHGLLCRKAQRKNAVDEQEFALMEENAHLQQDIECQLVKLADDRKSVDSTLENVRMKLKRCTADLEGLQKMATAGQQQEQKTTGNQQQSTENPINDSKNKEHPALAAVAPATVRSKSRDQSITGSTKSADTATTTKKLSKRRSKSRDRRSRSRDRRSKSRSRDRRSRSSGDRRSRSGSSSVTTYKKRKKLSRKRRKSRSSSRSRSRRDRQKQRRSDDSGSSPPTIKSSRKSEKDEKTDVLAIVSSSDDENDADKRKAGSSKKDAKKQQKSRWDDATALKFDKLMYYDAGYHVCKLCRVLCATVQDFFEHLHSPKHKTLYIAKPWARHDANAVKPNPGPTTQMLPFKGVEFLAGCSAFYCILCGEFAGDPSMAEEHFKSSKHNEKYEAYIQHNPLYEKVYSLEKASLMKTSNINPTYFVAKLCEKMAAVVKPTQIASASSDAGGSQKTPHVPAVSGKVEPFKLKSKDDKTAELLKASAAPVFENAKIFMDVLSNPDAANISSESEKSVALSASSVADTSSGPFGGYQSPFYGPFINPPGSKDTSTSKSAAGSDGKNTEKSYSEKPSSSSNTFTKSVNSRDGDDEKSRKDYRNVPPPPPNAAFNRGGYFKAPLPRYNQQPPPSHQNVFGKHRPSSEYGNRNFANVRGSSSYVAGPRTYYPPS